MGIIVKMWMRVFGIIYGKEFRTNGCPLIIKKRSAVLQIGDNVTINSSFLSNLIGLYQRTIIVARENGNVTIGNNVGISGTTIHGTNISIGDYTIIGANSKLIDHDFHSLNYLERRTDLQENVKSKPIVIGQDVFVGCNTIILKGTVIGDRCVIGAGSVVSGVFPCDSLIAGNPAVVLKTLKKEENGT